MVEPLSSIDFELERLQFNEFATTVTQNISELDFRPQRSKMFRMSFLVRVASLTIL